LLKSHAGYVELANAEISPAHQLTPDAKGAKMPLASGQAATGRGRPIAAGGKRLLSGGPIFNA
jgi:hypothetical protein